MMSLMSGALQGQPTQPAEKRRRWVQRAVVRVAKVHAGQACACLYQHIEMLYRVGQTPPTHFDICPPSRAGMGVTRQGRNERSE